MQNVLIRNSMQRTKYKIMETQQDRFGRLSEFEREHKLDKVRDFMIENRMTFDPKRPLPKPIRSLLDISSDITQLSPLVRQALNFDAIKTLAVRSLDLSVTDIVKYIVGVRDPLFEKIKILDPERFTIALEKTNANKYMKADEREPEKKDLALVPDKTENNARGKANDIKLYFDAETKIENYLVNQVYLTDGFLCLENDYDYLEGKLIW